MNLPYRMCQAVAKLFGTPAQQASWGLEEVPNLCDRVAALEERTITVERKTVLVGCAAIRSDADANTAANTFNASVVENAEGRWTITFGTTHPIPDGEFFFSVAGEEDANRDNPKITLVEGSDASTGAQIMVTVDDNGTGADVLEDNDFSFIVYAECEVISQVYVNEQPAGAN